MASRYTALETADTALSTELNSLANDATCSVSSVISNDAAAEREPLGVVELVIAAQGSARSSGASVAVYLLPTLDGTNYSDVVTKENNFHVSFSMDAATTARTIVKYGVPLPPCDFKAAAKNSTGQAFASSGNTVKIRRYLYEDA